MSSITTINGSDVISTSRTDINTNFSNLNTDKIETSVLDTDTTLAANSDAKVATQKATKAYVDASVNPTGRSWNEYAVDSVGSDSYAITVSGISAYVAGQTFKFKAGTANTGACSLNVNALGAKTIKKDVSSDLVTGDILVNQVVVVTYDGTNFQLVSPVVITPEWDYLVELQSDFTVNNDGTLSTVTGFSFAAGASDRWEIEIAGASFANSTTGDIIADIITTGTWIVDGSYSSATYYNATSVLTNRANTAVSSTTAALGSLVINNGDIATPRSFQIRAQVIMSGAGNIVFQIANSIAGSGRDSTIKAGTYLRARKLSI